MSKPKEIVLGKGVQTLLTVRGHKRIYFLLCMASSLFVVFKLEYCRQDILLANVGTLGWLASGYQYAVFWQLLGFTLLFGTTVEFVMGAL
jgi:hypothetical protein